MPEQVSDHGVATTMQVPGLHNNPLRMSGWIGIGEAADLLFLGVNQPADTVLWCMAINKWAVLVWHPDTMAKRPCECWANWNLQSVVHARNHQPESRNDVSAGVG